MPNPLHILHTYIGYTFDSKYAVTWVNAATQLAEASWRREKSIYKVFHGISLLVFHLLH